jgi:hypothetical protein
MLRIPHFSWLTSVDMHTTMEELLDTVFSILPFPKLCDEDQIETCVDTKRSELAVSTTY